jgi:poly(A) polymerase
LDVVVQRAEQPLVRAALLDTDRRVGEGKPVAPSFLLACVLWADVREGWARHLEGQGRPAPFPALQEAIDEVFHARIGDVSGGGKLAGDMREIWMMQPRFEKRTGSTPFGLVEQPRFRAAFDFMRLRAETGEVEEVLSDWWQEFSVADDNLRRDMVDGVRLEQTQKPRVQRAPRPAAAPRRDGEAAAAPQAASDVAPPDDRPEGETPDFPAGTDAPRKRRRRRRPGGTRPQGDTGDAPSGGSSDNG